MQSIVPPSTPKMKVEQIRDLIEAHQNLPPVVIVGVRGYYKNSMGELGKNDRGIYDDALFILADDCFIAFNANTDPGSYKPGIASLKEGRWLYKLGIHGLSKPKPQQYKALVQADEVTVLRDGEFSGSPTRHTVEALPHEDTGFFGINIHRGSFGSVSSLGCQTIHPTQWTSFITTIEAQLLKNGQKVVPYILTKA